MIIFYSKIFSIVISTKNFRWKDRFEIFFRSKRGLEAIESARRAGIYKSDRFREGRTNTQVSTTRARIIHERDFMSEIIRRRRRRRRVGEWREGRGRDWESNSPYFRSRHVDEASPFPINHPSLLPNRGEIKYETTGKATMHVVPHLERRRSIDNPIDVTSANPCSRASFTTVKRLLFVEVLSTVRVSFHPSKINNRSILCSSQIRRALENALPD